MTKALTELIKWTGILLLVVIVLYWFESGFGDIVNSCLQLT